VNGEVIKQFLVGLGFQIDQGGLDKFTSGISSATLKISAIGAAATAAVGGLTYFISTIADSLDQVGDLADRVNTSAEEIMKLGYIATLTGSSVEAAKSSLEGLSKTAGEAALGIGRGAMAFQKLGITAKDQSGKLKDTSVLLGEIREKIKGMERGEQVAVLSKLGLDPTMIGALTSDVSGLAEEFDSLYKNAGVDANKAAEQAGAFNDSMDRLRMTFDAIKKAVGLRFMNQLKNGIDTVRKFLVENMPKIINAITPIISLVMRVADAFVKIVGRVAQALETIIVWLVKLNDATGGWSSYILAAAAAWKFLNLAFLATPFGQIIALASTLALLADDFMTFIDGGQSFIDWSSTTGQVIGALTVVIGGFITYLAASKAAVLGMIVATQAWAAVMGFINSVMYAARVAVLTFNLALYANPIAFVIAAVVALGAAGYALIKNWDTVKRWFTQFFDWLVGGFSKLSGLISKLTGGTVKIDAAATGAMSRPTTPSPQAAASLTAGAQTVSQQTQIVVQGAGNPDATARAVAGQQNRVNADMTRNMRGAAR